MIAWGYGHGIDDDGVHNDGDVDDGDDGGDDDDDDDDSYAGQLCASVWRDMSTEISGDNADKLNEIVTVVMNDDEEEIPDDNDDE